MRSFWRTLVAADRELNYQCGGMVGETICARAARLAEVGCRSGRVAVAAIDCFAGAGHCTRALVDKGKEHN